MSEETAVTKKQQFLQLVQTHEGISKDEVKELMSVSDQSVYSMVYSLKQEGIGLYMGKDGKYHIRAQRKEKTEEKSSPKSDTTWMTEVISNVPEDHRGETCNLLYQAVFAQKAFEKNLEAHIETMKTLEQAGIHYHA